MTSVNCQSEKKREKRTILREKKEKTNKSKQVTKQTNIVQSHTMQKLSTLVQKRKFRRDDFSIYT